MMKKFLFITLFCFFLITMSFAQTISPGAQSILDRLPPDQKAMALSEIDRLKKDDHQGQKTTAITEIDKEQKDSNGKTILDYADKKWLTFLKKLPNKKFYY